MAWHCHTLFCQSPWGGKGVYIEVTSPSPSHCGDWDAGRERDQAGTCGKLYQVRIKIGVSTNKGTEVLTPMYRQGNKRQTNYDTMFSLSRRSRNRKPDDDSCYLALVKLRAINKEYIWLLLLQICVYTYIADAAPICPWGTIIHSILARGNKKFQFI